MRSPKKISVTKLLIVISVFSFMLSSCSRNTANLFVGVWTIEDIAYKGKDIGEKISLNALVFKENNEVMVPGIVGELLNKKDRQGKWNIDEDGFLIITSNNQYINGRAKYCFENSEDEELLKVVIETEELYMEAFKLFSKNDTYGRLPCINNALPK
ncbi:hypothetical protein J4E06_06660 [Muricauda sp. NFXS6]|uniref:hypothetical protein n=1 Tax=Allomuricauda sp. NFXS6 TaxID=2819094 RepID=UPI0032DFE009